MENKQIKDLMAAMEKTGSTRVRIVKGDVEVEIERAVEVVAVPAPVAAAPAVAAPPPAAPAAVAPSPLSPAAATDASGQAAVETDNSIFVTSPIVGVFYGTPSPDDPPFVAPGERVEPDTVVCIIEAMKVMNEVKAGVSGVLKEALVDRGHPVEFGAKLFRVEAE